MKIQVGVGGRDEFLYFLNSGADEFYAGLSSIPGHLYGGDNFSKEEELIEACFIAHSKGKKFFIAANEVRADLFDYTFEKLVYLFKEGIDGFILRDLSLLSAIKKKGIKAEIILSSLALCFNKDCLDFYADLGVNRLAIPEHILPFEAKSLIRNRRKIETEVFLTAREYCVVLNGFCYLKQFNGNCICRAAFKKGDSIFAMPRFSVKDHFSNLWDFYSMGAGILKIGRHPDKYYGKFVFKEVMAIRELLENCKDREEFVEKSMRVHSKFTEFLKKWKKKK